MTVKEQMAVKDYLLFVHWGPPCLRFVDSVLSLCLSSPRSAAAPLAVPGAPASPACPACRTRGTSILPCAPSPRPTGPPPTSEWRHQPCARSTPALESCAGTEKQCSYVVACAYMSGNTQEWNGASAPSFPCLPQERGINDGSMQYSM